MSNVNSSNPDVGFIASGVLGDSIHVESRKKNDNGAFEERMKAFGKAFSDLKKKEG